MNNKIKVIDSCMGSGKSTYIRNYMKSNQEKRFVYLTPFNDEVDKTALACPENYFALGKKYTKVHDLAQAIADGKSAIATHKAFEMSSHEDLALAEDQEYTLIIDESMTLIEFLPVKKSDIVTFDGKNMTVGDDGLVEWIKDDYNGHFNTLKDLAQQGKIRYTQEQLAKVLPPDFFRYFSEVYIISYMFKAQPMYYYLLKYGFDLEFYQVETIRPYVDESDTGEYKLIPHTGEYMVDQKLKERLEIYDGPLNKIGERNSSLSWSWHKQRGDRLTKLKYNIRNFFRTYCKTQCVDQVLWTCYKGDKNKWYNDVKPNSYVKGFLAHNAKATNDFIDRIYLAYCINRRIEPSLKRFLVGEGEFDEDSFALTEMLQWVYRSNIRDQQSNQKVVLYLPSQRMRNLLNDYMYNNA